MKNFLILLFLLTPLLTYSQEFIESSEFENKVKPKSNFGEDEIKIVVIEFWAKFNAQNDFKDWDKIEGADYYRVDISQASDLKKEYKIRMAPTLIIFKDGIKQISYKAGLDLVCPTTLEELQEDIDELKTASKF